MRLQSHEVDAIRAAVREIFGPTARTRLFGSRTRDDLRGGDIDLFVEVEPGQASILTTQSRMRCSRLSRSSGAKMFAVSRGAKW